MDKNLIAKIKEYFAGQPVVRAWLFGSMSRGSENATSDVDILVQFDPHAQVGLFEHASMVMDLESILRRAVDLVTDGTLLPWVREQADRDKILIYERETA
jgi:predicted nucleotidyltransferase